MSRSAALRPDQNNTVQADEIGSAVALGLDSDSKTRADRLRVMLNAWVAVSGARICEEFIADFENVLTSQDEAVLNTNEAAAMTGYSRAQLLHLYKQGRLRGHRNGKHVFFRAGDLPRKPSDGWVVVVPKATLVDEEARAGARRLAARLMMGSAPSR